MGHAEQFHSMLLSIVVIRKITCTYNQSILKTLRLFFGITSYVEIVAVLFENADYFLVVSRNSMGKKNVYIRAQNITGSSR